MDPSVRIKNRAQLIYLLTEAPELEHGAMCLYLQQAAAWAPFTERLKELSTHCGFLQAEEEVSATLARVRGSLDQYAEQFSA